MANKVNLEKSLGEIEEIVSKLEKGNITIDESIKLFESGAKKIKECGAFLEKMEEKISSVVINDDNYSLDKFDFHLDSKE
ncbi:MAG: exodeoxyribonuclease VII small subunit [Pseudomonadota bacterium]